MKRSQKIQNMYVYLMMIANRASCETEWLTHRLSKEEKKGSVEISAHTYVNDIKFNPAVIRVE